MAVIKQMPVHEKASRYLRKIEQEGPIYHPQMVNMAFMLRDDGCSYHQAVFIMHEASKTVTRREPRPGEITLLFGLRPKAAARRIGENINNQQDNSISLSGSPRISS